MGVITRFAPSPTGFLHIGNARTAVLCALLAKKTAGTFVLRIDDTDSERSEERFVTALQEDLAALGITAGRTERQSARGERYAECVEKLKQAGRLYDCYETPEEIDIKRKIALGRGLPPIYDREGLRLSEDEKAALRAEGRKPHWRFKLDESAPIMWNDAIRGELSFDPAKLSDPVLIRENGDPTYMLPSAIDDIDFGITDVVRGEDHISNTAIQIQLFAALGAEAPRFAHLSLMKTKDGKMSKRKGGFEVRSFFEEGIEPLALISYLARIGTSRPVEALTSFDAAADELDFSVFSKSPCIFDPDEILRLNAKIVHRYNFTDVQARPETAGADETFWEAVKGNLSTVAEIKDWLAVCRSEVTPEIEEPDYTQEAAAAFPEGEPDNTTWKTWTDGLKASTGRKGKALFMPLRKALTGMHHGPELDILLPLIGRERALKRLRGEKA